MPLFFFFFKYGSEVLLKSEQCASWGDYIKQNLVYSFPLLLLVKFQFPPSKSSYHTGLFSGNSKTFTKIPEWTKLISLFTSVLLGRKETTRILLLLTLLATRHINVTGCFQSYLMGASSSTVLVFHSFGSGRCCHSFLAQIPIFFLFSSMQTG